MLTGGHYVIPVIVTSSGAEAPQAVSLRLRLRGNGAATPSIHRAGAAAALQPAFEISRATESTLSYLVSYAQPLFAAADAGSAVVAEIELAPNRSGPLAITLDRDVTMLSNQSGTRAATARNGRLQLRGTAINNALPEDRQPPPHPREH